MRFNIPKWFLAQWTDVKGNAKWDLFKWCLKIGGVAVVIVAGAIWAILHPTTLAGWLALAALLVGLALVGVSIMGFILYALSPSPGERQSVPRGEESDMRELRALELIADVGNVILNTNCNAAKEERVYRHADANGGMTTVKPEPLEEVPESLIQRCHVVSLEWEGIAFSRLATALKSLQGEIAQFNASPGHNVRGIRVFSQQTIPSIIDMAKSEHDRQFPSIPAS